MTVVYPAACVASGVHEALALAAFSSVWRGRADPAKLCAVSAMLAGFGGRNK